MPTYLHCMTLGLCSFHQQVDNCQSAMVELCLQILVFLLGSYSHYEEFLHLLKHRARQIYLVPPQRGLKLKTYQISGLTLPFCQIELDIEVGNLVLVLKLYIQIGTNHMNKNRARVELYKLYTGPAFIHMVWRDLYFSF